MGTKPEPIQPAKVGTYKLIVDVNKYSTSADALIDIDRSLRELVLSGDIIDGGLAKDADPENANNMIY